MKKLLASFVIASMFAPQIASAEALWRSGAENNTTTATYEYHLVSGAGCTIDSTIKRSGDYSTKCTTAVSTRQGFVHQFAGAVGNGPYYFRAYIYVDTRAGGGSNTIFVASSAATISGSAWVAVYQETTGGLRLIINAATTLAGTSPVLTNGQWYRLEVLVNAVGGAGGGNDEVRAYLDGVEFAGANNLTLSGTFLAFRWGTNHLASASANAGTYYFDDIGVNDSTGSAQTGLPGEGRIVHGRPDSDGGNTAWTNSYTQVDEVTPDDATTIVSDFALNETEDFNFSVPAEIDSYDTISFIQVGQHYNRGGAAGTDTTFVTRHLTAGGGTLTEGTAQVANTTSWRGLRTSSPRNYPLTVHSPGTPSDIADDQIGVRVTVGGTSGRDAQVSQMWALIEYADGSPPPSGDPSGGSPIMYVRGRVNIQGNVNIRQ